MKVDKERLKKNLEELAEFGRNEKGGIDRLAWTEPALKAREYIKEKMEEAELEVYEDSVGNIFGRRIKYSRDSVLPAVMTGSHIDTPLNGGKYDGAVGVLGGLEAIRALNEAEVYTEHPLELAVFAGEELSRFGGSFKGSMGFAGQLSEELLQEKWIDDSGITYRKALEGAGYDPEDFEKAERSPGTVRCYYEMHIEQGRVLDEKNIPLGVVEAIAGATRGWAMIEGREDHSGATPMNFRKDALAAAAEVILALEKFGRREAYRDSVATVGDVAVEPGAMNVIPGKVKIPLEFRGTDKESKKRLMNDIDRKISEIVSARKISVDYSYHEDEDPCPIPEKSRSILKEACRERGYEYISMPSGAGHDAQIVAEKTRIGMIFVPSEEGISHSPDEYTEIDDIVRGTEVLADVMLKESRAEA